MAMAAAGDRARPHPRWPPHGSAAHRCSRGRALGVVLFAALVFWFDPTRLADLARRHRRRHALIEVRELDGGRLLVRHDASALRRRASARLALVAPDRCAARRAAVRLRALSCRPTQAELAVRALWPLLVLWAFVYPARPRGGDPRRARGGAVEHPAHRDVHHRHRAVPARAHRSPQRDDPVRGHRHPALARSFDDARAGWSAGVLLGLGTAVGYEALALTAASLGAAMLYGVLPEPQPARPLARRRRLRRHARRGAGDHHRARAAVRERTAMRCP